MPQWRVLTFLGAVDKNEIQESRNDDAGVVVFLQKRMYVCMCVRVCKYMYMYALVTQTKQYTIKVNTMTRHLHVYTPKHKIECQMGN